MAAPCRMESQYLPFSFQEPIEPGGELWFIPVCSSQNGKIHSPQEAYLVGAFIDSLWATRQDVFIAAGIPLECCGVIFHYYSGFLTVIAV